MHDLRGFSASKSRDLVEKAFNEAIVIWGRDKVSQPSPRKPAKHTCRFYACGVLWHAGKPLRVCPRCEGY